MDYSEQEKLILSKARELENSTIGEHTSGASSDNEKHDKGAFGQYLQTQYFHIEKNNRPEPDFAPVPLELKAAPLKLDGKGKKLIPKERIVLGMINFEDIVNEQFESSHFKYKNESILIVWYIYNKLLNNADMKIDIVDIWKCIAEDGKQIERDWNTIADKVKSGHAEDISEGDTLFIGACTKGSTAAESYRKQPYSDVLAKQRAFCFKQAYVNHIYETMQGRKKSRKNEARFIPSDSKFSLEETVENLFSPYMNKTSKQIETKLGISPKSKAKYPTIARTILGYSQKNKSFYEFSAANIQIKTIRLEKNGIPKEDMSFKNIKFKEIVSQTWEDSDLYQELVSKFIFVIFSKTDDGKDYYLSGIKFWNMPEKDLDVAQLVWKKTKERCLECRFDSLPKKSENPIIHVRTKGKDSTDLTETADGSIITKRCFFLNNTYIAKECQ